MQIISHIISLCDDDDGGGLGRNKISIDVTGRSLGAPNSIGDNIKI